LGVVAGASRFVEPLITSPNLPDIKGADVFARMFEQGDLDTINEISRLVVQYNKPIVAVTLTSVQDKADEAMMQKKNILVYTTPERAAKALSKLYEYQRYIDSTARKGSELTSKSPHRRLRKAERSKIRNPELPA
jgi:acyl-CoA synthetase (NDP forming)